jgi:hypothetical protein
MRGLLCLVALAASVAAAPIPKSIKKNNRSLDGQWQVTGISIGDSNYDGKNSQLWIIDGESMKLSDQHEGSKRIDKLVKVDDGGLDWVIDESGTVRTYKGLYDIEDGVWRFCFSTTPDQGERPTAIGKGKSVYLYTFQRAEGK